MFWKKKIKDPKKGTLTKIEQEVFDQVVAALPEKQAKLVKEQLSYLELMRRIEYNKDVVTELYPVHFDKMPKTALFERTEEFRLAHVTFRMAEVKYVSEIHAVLGRIFDIKIRPKPPKKLEADIELLQVKLNEELEKNIN